MNPDPIFIDTPGKDETLLGKVEARNSKRHLLGGVRNMAPENWVNLGESLYLLVLILLNYWLLSPFLGSEDLFNAFSAPLVPILATLSSTFVPYPYGVRIWLLVFFLFFPVSFYLFIREISKRKFSACLASLIAILPYGLFLPSRIRMGLLAGDGAHLASLTLIFLACTFLLRFLRRGNFSTGVLTSLVFAMVALTSPLGMMVLICFALAITFSEMLLGEGRIKFFRFLTVAFFSVGFSAFWYNPKFVILTINSPAGILVRQAIIKLLPLSFFLIPLLGTFGFLLFENRPNLQSLFVAAFLTIGFGLLFLGTGLELQEPSRFLPVVGVSLAFLLGVCLTNFLDFLKVLSRLESFKHRLYLRRIFPPILVSLVPGLFLMIILLGRNLKSLEEAQVLGLSSVRKVGIWQIREESSGLYDLAGAGITLFTFGSVAFLGRDLRKKQG